ncbi:MAG TPA: helix-turn-helix domain-containing protein [Candidatus Faecimonas gallistercoris]|nr:helix-turn-helix domain-containing protein [Candidatus Faecimonas gallistercoris]
MQIELVQKIFRCTRIVYNHYLDKKKTLYEAKKDTISYFEKNHKTS